MKRKVLLISEIFPPVHGGSGRWFWELYSRLPKENYFIAAGYHQEASSFDKTHSLNVFRINLSSNSWGIKSWEGAMYYLKSFIQIRKIIKNHQITQLHCGRCLPEGVLGLLAKKIFNIDYLCYIHGEDIEAASCSRELSLIVKLVLKNSLILIANSKNTRSILLDNWNIPIDKIKVLHPGMDATKFTPAPYNEFTRKTLLWDNRPVILTVGRLQKRKGHDMLLKALPSIIKSFPDVLYAVIGEGEEKETLLNLVEDLNIQSHVQFMSELSDEKMIQCYQQCTLFALPNRTVGKDIEGFGMVLCEAQACGKPVLAGDSGGTSETMKIDKTGYIIDCTEPSVISDKIINILSDPEWIQRAASLSRDHAQQNYDWESHTILAEKIFRET